VRIINAPINFGNVVSGSIIPPTTVNGTYFYFRATGFLVPSITGVYTIGVNCADGCNVFIGNQAMVSALPNLDTANALMAYTRSSTISLVAGLYYPFVIEWQHGSGIPFELQLLWTDPAGTFTLIPSGNLSASNSSATGTLSAQWWNGTNGLWYPSGVGTIDFANTNHPNKNIDNIDDGDIYIRTKRSNVSVDGLPISVAGSGSSLVAATSATNVATAPSGDVITSDGSGNVQDSGVLLTGLLPKSGGTLTGQLIVPSGDLLIQGVTYGTTIETAASANWTLKLPATAGTNLYVLQTDGSGNCTWVAQSGGGSGTVDAGTANCLAYYGASTAEVSAAADTSISGGALTLGSASSVNGQLILAQTTAYATTIKGAATANWTFTLPTTAGTNLYVLQTDGSGNTSWVPQAGASSITGGGAVSHQWVSAITSGGACTLSQPAFADLASTPTTMAGYGITSVAWSLLTSTPTTLSGYGITDALPKAGGTMSGALSIPSGDLVITGATYNTTIAQAASANWTLTLPATAGTNLYVLQTDGSGNTSWVALPAAGLATTGGTMSGALNIPSGDLVIVGASHNLTIAAAPTAAWTFTYPPTAGTSGYVLTTDGTGITSWAATSSLGTNAVSLQSVGVGSQTPIDQQSLVYNKALADWVPSVPGFNFQSVWVSGSVTLQNYGPMCQNNITGTSASVSPTSTTPYGCSYYSASSGGSVAGLQYMMGYTSNPTTFPWQFLRVMKWKSALYQTAACRSFQGYSDDTTVLDWRFADFNTVQNNIGFRYTAGESMAATAAQPTIQGYTNYTVPSPEGSGNRWVGQYFNVTGFDVAGNNGGPWLCVASANASIVLATGYSNSTLDTHAGTLKSVADTYWQCLTSVPLAVLAVTGASYSGSSLTLTGSWTTGGSNAYVGSYFYVGAGGTGSGYSAFSGTSVGNNTSTTGAHGGAICTASSAGSITLTLTGGYNGMGSGSPVAIQTSGFYTLTATTNAPDTNPHDFQLCWDDTNVTFWIDNVLVATQNTNLPASSVNVALTILVDNCYAAANSEIVLYGMWGVGRG